MTLISWNVSSELRQRAPRTVFVGIGRKASENAARGNRARAGVVVKAQAFAFGAAAFGHAGTVAAYVGPGAGLPLVGMLVALVTAVLLAILGFVWYPAKRFLRQRKLRRTAAETAANPSDRPEPKDT